MSIAFHDIPNGFDLRDLLLRRHKRLFEEGLDGKVYDRVLEHFCETLRDLNVREETIAEALSIVQPYRAIFEEGAQIAAIQKEHDMRSQLLWRLIIGGSILLYVGGVILARRRK